MLTPTIEGHSHVEIPAPQPFAVAWRETPTALCRASTCSEDVCMIAVWEGEGWRQLKLESDGKEDEVTERFPWRKVGLLFRLSRTRSHAAKDITRW